MDCCVLLVLVLSVAATAATVAPEAATADALLSAKMEEFYVAYNATAAVSYVANQHEVCASGSAGSAQEVDQEPDYNKLGRQHMGSNTKSMTATLVGILLEQNKVLNQGVNGWNTTPVGDTARAGGRHAV
jgi:CubicO group peptidase (beta-lactamase class C family)